jgi:hypothetical protein
MSYDSTVYTLAIAWAILGLIICGLALAVKVPNRNYYKALFWTVLVPVGLLLISN